MSQSTPIALKRPHPPDGSLEADAPAELRSRDDATVAATLLRRSRTGSAFTPLFGASPVAVIRSMDAAADDIAYQQPASGGAIGAVGFSRKLVPVSIRDPFGGDGQVTALCTVDVSGAVPAHKRGLHLSRMGHAIATNVVSVHHDLMAFAQRLAHDLAETQYGKARVKVVGHVPYVEPVETRGRSDGKLSLEHLVLFAGAAVRPGRIVTDAGMRVTHLVACPCVQQTYKHAMTVATGAASVPAIPLMTHSQRCSTAVTVRGLRAPFLPRAVLFALDAVLVRTCNTMPRDRELECVYRAHQAPQFVEDAVRAAAESISSLWPAAAYDRIHATSCSIESIHEFNLTASMTLLSPHHGRPQRVAV